MHSCGTKSYLRLSLVGSALALILSSGAVLAQSVEDNLRPVGQVCLAGQPCVGTARNAAASESSPVAEAIAETVETVQEVAETATAAVEDVAEEVAEAVAPASEFDVQAAYQMSCFACHGTGAAGAPKLGDAAVWEERMAKGMDAVMANVINGLNAMPARGLCFNCTDDNLRTLVEYMAAQ